VSVAMFDVMADWMAVPLLFHDYANQPTPRTGLGHSVICPYGAFRCQGGDLVVISVQNSREWKRFCTQILGNPALASDPRFHDNSARIQHKSELEALIKTVFGTHERAGLLKLLDSAGIASAAVNDVGSLSDHPQLDRSTVGTPSGPVSVAMPPIRRNGSEPTLGPSPGFDADGTALRAEFGSHS